MTRYSVWNIAIVTRTAVPRRTRTRRTKRSEPLLVGPLAVALVQAHLGLAEGPLAAKAIGFGLLDEGALQRVEALSHALRCGHGGSPRLPEKAHYEQARQSPLPARRASPASREKSARCATLGGIVSVRA